jgi:replicative DNA helicase
MEELMNEKPVTSTKTDVKRRRPITPANISEYGKLPPQAIEVEEIVLGSMMLEKNAVTAVVDLLKPQVFYKESHQRIFAAISSLFAKSEPIDIITVTNELRIKGDLEIIGGPYYIAQLTNRVATASNIEFHARIIIEKFIAREMIRISSEIVQDAYQDSTDVFDLLDKAEANLFAVSEENFRRHYDTMQSLVRKAIDEIQKARSHGDNLTGVPSGFTKLDRITGGWQKSDLIVIAARPGMGKTAFILSMARNMAIDFKKAVAVFSLEMSSVQLVTRLISSETQLPADKLRRGNLEDYEWEQLNAKINKLIDAPIFIDDTAALSIFELRAKCRRLKEQHDIQLIMVDYIQLMTAGGTDGKTNREQEISTISRSLKSLAKELNVPVIILSQLNRDLEKRAGSKKPILSDLRESGAIEQDADIVVFIYRPEYYKIENDEYGPTLGMADVIIAKHRNGALEDVRLKFVNKYAKFEDTEDANFNIPDILPSSTFEQGGVTTVNKLSKMDDYPF